MLSRWLLALALGLASSVVFATVNLNTATKDDLVALPGIGPAKAQAILDYRKANGPFKAIDELKDVKGIGAKRFEKLKGDLTVGPAAAPTRAVAAKGEARPEGKGPAARGEIKAAPEPRAAK